MLNGLTQDRVRRLVSLLRSQCGRLRELPQGWTKVLPRDAPLASLDLWRRDLERIEDWPGDADFSEFLLNALEPVAQGPNNAREAGERLLRGLSLSIWRQASARSTR